MAGEVELFDDWGAAAAAGGSLLDARPLLFERFSWYHLLAQHCPPAGCPLIARAGDTWLFLAKTGRCASAYANWYSLRFAPAGPPDGIAPIASALRKCGLHRVEMAPVEDPEPLARGFRDAGWLVFRSPATASWQLSTEGLTFEAYWAKRPSRLRNTADRKAKGLEIAVARGFDPAAYASYEEVYGASWKPREGSPAFLRALAEQQSRSLRLGVARHRGRAVAAQLWLTENGTAMIHKLAYREDARALAAGTVLSAAMFRSAIEDDQVSRIDYGTGDEPYKAEWMDERRTLWRLTAYDPRSATGLTRLARAGASGLVRRWRSR